MEGFMSHYVSRTVLCALLVMGCSPTAREPAEASLPDVGAPAEEAIGTIVFPTSGSPGAQKYFLRGVTILHSFGWKQAIAEFQRAQELDPDFAMAYWGETLCYNHPLFRRQDLEKPREVLARLGLTPEERAAKAPTEREKGFLHAVEVLFANRGDVTARKVAHRDAMRRLYEQYPDDPEVAAFYSLAIQAVAYLNPEQNVRERVQAGAIALDVFARNPDHPGAAHYIIHAFDDPVHAPLALPAADRFAEIAAAVSHARHMPSHIFIQLGMWDRVTSSNDSAFAVAEELWEPGDSASAMRHALDWGQYGDLQRGDYEKARRWIDVMEGIVERSDDAFASQTLPLVKARYVIETEQWQVLPVTEQSSAPELLATGISAARTGDYATAEDARARLETLATEAASKPASRFSRSEPITISELEVAALIELGQGRTQAALEYLEQGIALANSMGTPRGPAQPLKPVHELYAEVRLELGQLDEAVGLFEASLRRTPNRPRSLLGLARTYAAQGRSELAAEQYGKLAQIWEERKALPELDEALDYLAGEDS
jgi:tetratricopeptide (TPR) repeat protein